MSSFFVRSQLRQAWPLITPTIPYFETITVSTPIEVKNHDVWGTFVFDVTARGHATMGTSPWIVETGTAIAVLMAKSGVTDEMVSVAAEQVMRNWEAWQSSDKMLWIQSVDAPRPPDAESSGDLYRLAVVLSYEYQTRKEP